MSRSERLGAVVLAGTLIGGNSAAVGNETSINTTSSASCTKSGKVEKLPRWGPDHLGVKAKFKKTTFNEAMVYFRWQTKENPKLDINMIAVNLNAPWIDLEATPPSRKTRSNKARTMTVPKFAQYYKLKAAINANFYDIGKTYKPEGLAAGNGKQWKGAEDDKKSNTFYFFKKEALCGWKTEAKIARKKDIVKFNDKIDGAVSGRTDLVLDGKIALSPDEKQVGPKEKGFCGRNPRTIVGLSENIVTMATIDGRRTDSVGVTCLEGAKIAKKFSKDAIYLDGGGSTTMAIEKNHKIKVVNIPSDGINRSVPTHLGIFVHTK